MVYLGFNAALSRWPSVRVYARAFLVPAVAVVVEAFRGSLPGAVATVGVELVILGVAVVNHPAAEALAAAQLNPAVLGAGQRPVFAQEPRHHGRDDLANVVTIGQATERDALDNLRDDLGVVLAGRPQLPRRKPRAGIRNARRGGLEA